MVSQKQDPHQGGTLSEMAATGTSIPNDAGLQRTIPSVPRPDQCAEHFHFDNEGLAQPSAATAVDNATDMPRSTRDVGVTGEVVTGTGDTLPVGAEAKRAFMGTNIPATKGDARDVKHAGLTSSAFDRFVKEDGDSGEKVREHTLRNG
ncbi:hypothetical protein NUU61_005260 [Penicillium alfredii]|uniref:Uncharacterized protein n=1 Tax=Penicillium alfredii TaxID=1506179 RepID=A0A9W9F982_9EURO|nr:uncharacterized protein NUU61_005260 [Penicillium alfredii]KAJ5095904.1 hypothetical protein NUU61_005260 [Penicillium alfredii]